MSCRYSDFKKVGCTFTTLKKLSCNLIYYNILSFIVSVAIVSGVTKVNNIRHC